MSANFDSTTKYLSMYVSYFKTLKSFSKAGHGVKFFILFQIMQHL